jgi:NAD(P)-dependent dehydrogenase (short-subunit alcohol dehydrogenase family)
MSNQKVAIVTGSSRGIGRGIALGLAEHGWDVVVNYHNNIAAAEDVIKQCKPWDRMLYWCRPMLPAWKT